MRSRPFFMFARRFSVSQDSWLLFLLAAFTVVSVAGYATFGLHPGWLANLPQLAAFYGVAFGFFAQGHVWLAGLVLGWYLVRRTRTKWVAAFVVVYLLSFLSEFVGTGYGIPFGSYGYTELLGPKWFDRVPVIIPLSWFAMTLPAYALARYRFPGRRNRILRVTFAPLLLVAWDLALDPAMSHLTKYWRWGEAGSYYGMPMVNLVGWYVTGVLLMGSLEALRVQRWVRRLSERWLVAYYLITVLMPLGMVAVAGLWGAVVLTVVSLVVLGSVIQRGKDGAGRVRCDTPEVAQEDVQRNGEDREQVDVAARFGRFVRAATADTEGLRAYFVGHSRSFSFAARLFSPQQQHLVTCLYAFCRTVDDVVDRHTDRPREEVTQELHRWLEQARKAYQGEDTGLFWLDTLMHTSARVGVPFTLVEELIRGVQMDLGRVSMRSFQELNTYTYRVASVVGMWLCYLFGVRDSETLHRAAAMGRAMQLTNILRDVGEDLSQGRLYLPADVRAQYGVSRADLEHMARSGRVSVAYRRLMEDMLERAEREYAYAFEGLGVLPRSFARASAVAAEVYRGIHQAIRRNGYDNFRRRAYTRLSQKMYLAVRALVRLRRLHGKRPALGTSPAPVRTNRRPRRDLVGSWLFALAIPAVVTLGSVGTLAARSTAFSLSAEVSNHMVMRDSVRLERLRTLYVDAATHSAAIDRALAIAQTGSSSDPVFEAYEAALTVLRAKYSFWPVRKLRYLHEGLPVLDSLVAAHPSHPEIRYLRLLSCYFLPGILGRSWSVEEDFRALARLLPYARSEFPSPLYRDMIGFVLENGTLDDESRRRLMLALSGEADEPDEPVDSSSFGARK